jgi:glyoxylase I family protein
MSIALHHVSLLIDDLARARAFYVDVLGLAEDQGRPDLGYPGAWLLLPAGLQLHLLQLPNPDADAQRPEHGGRDRHVAFVVDDLQGLQTRLDAAGVSYTRSRSGRAALFCRDPDGNALEWIQREAP